MTDTQDLPALHYAHRVLENIRDLVLPEFAATDAAHVEVATAIAGLEKVIAGVSASHGESFSGQVLPKPEWTQKP
jgi:hypothetical protein